MLTSHTNNQFPALLSALIVICVVITHINNNKYACISHGNKASCILGSRIQLESRQDTSSYISGYTPLPLNPSFLPPSHLLRKMESGDKNSNKTVITGPNEICIHLWADGFIRARSPPFRPLYSSFLVFLKSFQCWAICSLACDVMCPASEVVGLKFSDGRVCGNISFTAINRQLNRKSKNSLKSEN